MKLHLFNEEPYGEHSPLIKIKPFTVVFDANFADHGYDNDYPHAQDLQNMIFHFKTRWLICHPESSALIYLGKFKLYRKTPEGIYVRNIPVCESPNFSKELKPNQIFMVNYLLEMTRLEIANFR